MGLKSILSRVAIITHQLLSKNSKAKIGFVRRLSPNLQVLPNPPSAPNFSETSWCKSVYVIISNMEDVDQEVLSQIKLGETEIVTEKLDGAPRILLDRFGDLGTIEFGNTGFKILLNRDTHLFDFTPENSLYPEEEKASKYASMLAVSFLELHKLLNNPEKISEFRMDDVTIRNISAITNTRLINAIKELFSRSGVTDLAFTGNKEDKVIIDLRSFKELEEDDSLIKYLNKVSGRARNLTVTYQKTIKQP